MATPERKLSAPEAAAAALPPLSDEAVAVIARIFNAIEARRHESDCSPETATPTAA